MIWLPLHYRVITVSLALQLLFSLIFFSEHPSLTILPVTTELRSVPLFRIMIEPTEGNNLKKRSQVMVDKVQTVPRDKIGPTFGRLDDALMLAVNRALAVWLGFA